MSDEPPALAAATFRAEPSAVTFVFGPMRMTVNETDLPALEKFNTTMLALLITDDCDCHPCCFMIAR